MTDTSLIVGSFYFGNTLLWANICKAGRVAIESHENYLKQTYRNRTYILSAQGVKPLTVPVHASGAKYSIKEVRIDYSEQPLRQHLRTLKTCYAAAPFFEHYFPHIESIMNNKPVFLFDLNMELCNWLCSKVAPTVSISFTSVFEKVYTDKKVQDLRKDGGELISATTTQVKYPQTFGNIFVPNLSIADMLFNNGPATVLLLKDMVAKEGTV